MLKININKLQNKKLYNILTLLMILSFTSFVYFMFEEDKWGSILLYIALMLFTLLSSLSKPKVTTNENNIESN